MTLPIRLFALALLLAAGCAPRSTMRASAQTARPVLFALAVEPSGAATLLPIGFLGADSLRGLPPGGTDSASAQFRREQLQVGRRYPVWIAGAAAGWATVEEAKVPLCSGFAGAVRLDLAAAMPVGAWGALAGSLPGPSRTPVRRAPTRAERAAIDTLAARELRARGVSEAEVAGGEATVAAVRYPSVAGEVLVASYFLPVYGDAEGRSIALLLIAEPAPEGYRRAWVWWHDGGESDVVRSDFLDALDVEGDGVPELVFRTRYYESWDFQLLARRAGGWVESYRGGDGGC